MHDNGHVNINLGQQQEVPRPVGHPVVAGQRVAQANPGVVIVGRDQDAEEVVRTI